MAALLRDPDFQDELFVLLNTIFSDDVLAAVKAAAKALAADLYDIMDAAGVLPPGTPGRQASIGQLQCLRFFLSSGYSQPRALPAIMVLAGDILDSARDDCLRDLLWD